MKEKYGFKVGGKVYSDLSLKEHKVSVRQAKEFGLESKFLISKREEEKE